jgi:hypothetical protein
MTLPASGAISLGQMHTEVGSSATAQAALNDADIRALIGKSANSSMAFNEWYGASATDRVFTFTGQTHSGVKGSSIYGVRSGVPSVATMASGSSDWNKTLTIADMNFKSNFNQYFFYATHASGVASNTTWWTKLVLSRYMVGSITLERSTCTTETYGSGYISLVWPNEGTGSNLGAGAFTCTFS